MPPTARISYVCTTCRSDRVKLDAWAAWSVETQSWELEATMQMAFCEDCNCETTITHRILPDPPPAADHQSSTATVIDGNNTGSKAIKWTSTNLDMRHTLTINGVTRGILYRSYSGDRSWHWTGRRTNKDDAASDAICGLMNLTEAKRIVEAVLDQ